MPTPPDIPKNVLLTGGSGGLGHALCLEFVRAGSHRISILDVDSAGGSALASQYPSVSFHLFDLAQFSPEMVDSLDGPFDALICNAGISACGNFRDTPWESERNLFDVNLFGHMRLVKELLRRGWLLPGARLAFTSSASLFTPFPLAVAYAATKAAMDGFANALEPYLIPQNISVSRIYPGTMRTAHQQAYYAAMNPATGADPASVAKRTFKGIIARKRHIYPDRMGKSFRLLSKIVPWAMPTLSYRSTKKYRAILYPAADPPATPPAGTL